MVILISGTLFEKIANAITATARDTICSSCLFRLSQHGFKPDLSQYWGITARYYASAATAEAAINPTQQSPQHDPQIPPVTASATRKAYRLSASPVLSRPPLLTRDLTSFEKAYYFYQKRLNERLALPFTRYFYIKKGTPADVEWKRKRAIRKTAGKDIGIYSGYGEEAWNDEVLVGDRLGEREAIQEALIRDAEGKDIVEASKVSDGDKGGKVSGDSAMGESMRKILQQQQVTVQQPMSRVSEADEKNDRRSLSRKMDRALYLLIQNKYGRWRFPEDRVYGRENLNQVRATITSQMYENPLTYLLLPGCRTHSHPILRHKHEYLDRRQSSRGPSLPQIHQAYARYHHAKPARLDFDRRVPARRARREDLLYERQDDGWTSGHHEE